MTSKNEIRHHFQLKESNSLRKSSHWQIINQISCWRPEDKIPICKKHNKNIQKNWKNFQQKEVQKSSFESEWQRWLYWPRNMFDGRNGLKIKKCWKLGKVTKNYDPKHNLKKARTNKGMFLIPIRNECTTFFFLPFLLPDYKSTIYSIFHASILWV